MRILCVDPGDKRIGLAVSDETATIANPYDVILHISRKANAKRIVDHAQCLGISRIVIGQSFDDEGNLSTQGRKAQKLAEAIKEITSIDIVFWDEGFSTQTVKETLRLASSTKKRKRALDDLAATVILQSYLDSINAGMKEQ